MTYPRLVIDLKKLEENIRFEISELKRFGVTLLGVNKVFNGSRETAQALVNAGVSVIAESRIYNLKNLQDLSCRRCLLRSPGISEIKETIEYADISLNSEVEIVNLLSIEAKNNNKIHEILFMVDMGDTREGIWFLNENKIISDIRSILEMPNIKIYGIGTNFNCYGAIKPTYKNGIDFVQLVKKIENKLAIKFPKISGGNCTSYNLISKNTWPAGINELRIGGLHQFGIDYVDMKYVEGFHHSTDDVMRATSPLYRLEAEIIELNEKPTKPYGEFGFNAFLETPIFKDRGIRKRALLSFGKQDIPGENCNPEDKNISVLGQSSDHTIIDIHDSLVNYKVGDKISFELDYTSLLFASNAPGIKKVYVS